MKMNVSWGLVLGNTTLQPLGTDLWQCNRPKIPPRLNSQWKWDAQEITSHLKGHLICRNPMATKSNAQNGGPVNRKDNILPSTQMECAYLGVKLLHQSLSNLVPYDELGNPQEVLKSLLSQKRSISWMGPKSKQCLEESGLGAPTTEPLAPLHLESEATCQHMHIIRS